jgi:oxygen-independent coproporphyrinogen-3 oxidase
VPDADAAWSMQEQGQAGLAQAGYAQYEVSAYAQPGRRSRHNLNYWEFGDYIGIGAGAHGKRSAADGIVRRARLRHPTAWLAAAGSGNAVQETRSVARDELAFEYAMNALRLNDGFRRADFTARTGLPRGVIEPPLAKARQRGMLEATDDPVRASALGRAHLNALVGLFLPPTSRRPPAPSLAGAGAVQ